MSFSQKALVLCFMKRFWQEYKWGIMGMLIFSTILFLIALLTDGTCDEGDSIFHYLYAKYAPSCPSNFLEHWAKPFYVLVMCPAAQFGFIGAKLQNTLFTCLTVWFTYLSARKLQLKWAVVVFPLALFFKCFIQVSMSGLTEPLHDMMLSIAIYLMLCRRYMWVAVIASFFPFVRSEGLFICGAFGVYFLFKRQWKAIPLLALGHIIYSIVGYPRFHDFLWTFHNIPYAQADGHYGHGNWNYYCIMMPWITGLVNAILLPIGIVFGVIEGSKMLYKRNWNSRTFDILFVIGLFLLFFAMHTTFWALGIFGSFGMVRVFVAIGCTIMLVIVYALEKIDALLGHYISWSAPVIFGLFIISSSVFGFTHLSRYHYDKANDFGLHADQLCDRDAATYVHSTVTDYTNYTYFMDATYIMEVMGANIFGAHAYFNTQVPATGYPPKSIAIWDDWYSPSECKISIEFLRNHKELKEIKTFTHLNQWGEERKVILFIRE